MHTEVLTDFVHLLYTSTLSCVSTTGYSYSLLHSKGWLAFTKQILKMTGKLMHKFPTRGCVFVSFGSSFLAQELNAVYLWQKTSVFAFVLKPRAGKDCDQTMRL